MGKNKELGQEGERLAVDYLVGKGFQIRETNFRYKRSEIDIIAANEQLLLFVEVKIRSTTSFGQPEDFVSENQVENIMQAAEHYILESDWKGNIRFDIISISNHKERSIEHFEDAFH